MNSRYNCPMCNPVAGGVGNGNNNPLANYTQVGFIPGGILAPAAPVATTLVGKAVFMRPVGYDKHAPVRGTIRTNAVNGYYTVEPVNSRGVVELWDVIACYLNENDAKKAMADSYITEAKRIADRAWSIIQSYKR
jgi:hypothetical protein